MSAPRQAVNRRWLAIGLPLAVAVGLAIWFTVLAYRRDEATAKPAAQPAAAASAWVSGRVLLGPAARSQVKPDDTVFIFARLVDGPRMPVAVLRRRGTDWPLEFVLDQRTATNPTLQLPPSMQLVVVARISRSGQEAPQPGDLQGHSAPVPVGTRDLEIEINETLR